MKDWAVRAIKTFVQAFFGVLVPAVCAMLSNGWPESISKAWVILAPTVAAALAAAISAVWNIILEGLENKTKIEVEYTGEKPPDTPIGKHQITTTYEDLDKKWRNEK